jgi:hypothetical protein
MAGGVVDVVGGAVVVLGSRREQHTLPATHTSLQIVHACKAEWNQRHYLLGIYRPTLLACCCRVQVFHRHVALSI